MSAKQNGNQAVATGAAILGCINWNRLSEDQLQELQRLAQNGEDFSYFLQDWLERGGWMAEASMLDRLGYDVTSTLKRLRPEMDELAPVTDFTGYVLTPMLQPDWRFPLHVYYRNLEESEPELFESCVGLQTLHVIKGWFEKEFRWKIIRGYSPDNTYRIFAPKSACMMRKNQPGLRRMPALIVGPVETNIEFVPFDTKLAYGTDFVFRRNV